MAELAWGTPVLASCCDLLHLEFQCLWNEGPQAQPGPLGSLPTHKGAERLVSVWHRDWPARGQHRPACCTFQKHRVLGRPGCCCHLPSTPGRAPQTPWVLRALRRAGG